MVFDTGLFSHFCSIIVLLCQSEIPTIRITKLVFCPMRSLLRN